MIEKITVHDVVNGLMKTGRYKCFVEQNDITLNLGHGEIDIIHIKKGLMKGNESCQFAIHNRSIYFRVVSNRYVRFVPVNIEMNQLGNESFLLELSGLSMSIRKLFNKKVVRIHINGSAVELLDNSNPSTNNRIISPFKKKIRKDFDTYISPFRKKGNGVSIQKSNPIDSLKTTYSNLNIKISSNNENSIKYKEERNGLLR